MRSGQFLTNISKNCPNCLKFENDKRRGAGEARDFWEIDEKNK